MRLIPTVLLTSTGAATLAVGAYVAAPADGEVSYERSDLPPILIGARLDAAVAPDADLAMASLDDVTGDGSFSDFGPSNDQFLPDSMMGGGDSLPLDEPVIPLAEIPGREHTMGGYAAGTANSDLPLEEGVELVAFDDLMLPDYIAPAVLTDEQGETRPVDEVFPEEIAALDGQRVALEGFMMPLEFSANKVIAFVLSPYPPGCCFGGMPMLDEWVDVVYTDDEGVEYFAYRVVRVTGELEVGEVLDDWGYVSSLYRMQTDKVEKLW